MSTLADSCPHCGTPVHHSTKADSGADEEEYERDRSGFFLKLFLVIVVLGVGYLFGKKQIDAFIMKHKGKLGFASKSEPNFMGVPKNAMKDSKDDSAPVDIAKSMTSPVPEKPDEASTQVPDLLGISGSKDSDNEKKEPEPKSLLPQGEENPKTETVVAVPQAKKAPVAATAKETMPARTAKPAESAAPTVEVMPEAKIAKQATTAKQAKVPPEAKVAKQAATAKEAPAAIPSAPERRLEMVLEKSQKLNPSIVAKMTSDEEDGKLTVVVNDNWSILSCEQKQAATLAIRKIWIDANGRQIVFVDGNGRVVASENRASELIRGRITFNIRGCDN